MSIMHVCLFGKFHIQLGEQIVVSPSARKVQELFCYLLLHRDHPHPRETLADLLWGSSPTAHSKKYLRQALWQLQAALNSQTEPVDRRWLLVEPEWVQINAEADLWLDVAVFEQAFDHAHGLPGRELDGPIAQSLQSAAELYQGDLLEGWYQDWCIYERERLQNMYLATLDKLMGFCEVHHDYETGLAYGTRILRYDRARERTHRRMMRLHYLARDRTAALRQYECCVAALDEELGVGPATRTVALCQCIRADRLDGPTPAMSRAQTSLLTEVLERLTQLRTALANNQRQIQQDIQAIERALTGGHC